MIWLSRQIQIFLQFMFIIQYGYSYFVSVFYVCLCVCLSECVWVSVRRASLLRQSGKKSRRTWNAFLLRYCYFPLFSGIFKSVPFAFSFAPLYVRCLAPPYIVFGWMRAPTKFLHCKRFGSHNFHSIRAETCFDSNQTREGANKRRIS